VASFGDPSWFLSLFSFEKNQPHTLLDEKLTTLLVILRKYEMVAYFWASFFSGVRVVICLMRCRLLCLLPSVPVQACCLVDAVQLGLTVLFRHRDAHCSLKHAVERCHLVLDGVVGFVDDEPLCVGWLAIDFEQQPRVIISPNFDVQKWQFGIFFHLVGEFDGFVLAVQQCQQIQHSILVNHSKNDVHVSQPDSREKPSALQLVLHVSHEQVGNEWGQCVALCQMFTGSRLL
jgi:hypothetical protein